MLLAKPQLKKRADGSSPKMNTVFGAVGSLFAMFANKISFHFFGNTYAEKCAWKVLTFTGVFDDSNILYDIIASEGKDISSDLFFLESNGYRYEYIIIDDSQKWNDPTAKIYIVSLSLHSSGQIITRTTQYSIDEFNTLLLALTHSDGTIMNKRLLYSSTELEGVLADKCFNRMEKRALFPGDVDMVIYKGAETRYLIEFKKHNLDSPIADESMTKYWYRDKRKYSSLFLLAHDLKVDYLYNLIYSTKQDCNTIKIEKVHIGTDIVIEDSQLFSFMDVGQAIRQITTYFGEQ